RTHHGSVPFSSEREIKKMPSIRKELWPAMERFALGRIRPDEWNGSSTCGGYFAEPAGHGRCEDYSSRCVPRSAPRLNRVGQGACGTAGDFHTFEPAFGKEGDRGGIRRPEWIQCALSAWQLVSGHRFEPSNPNPRPGTGTGNEREEASVGGNRTASSGPKLEDRFVGRWNAEVNGDRPSSWRALQSQIEFQGENGDGHEGR